MCVLLSVLAILLTGTRINLGLSHSVEDSLISSFQALSLYYQLSSGSSWTFSCPWAILKVSLHHGHHLPPI